MFVFVIPKAVNCAFKNTPTPIIFLLESSPQYSCPFAAYTEISAIFKVLLSDL